MKVILKMDKTDLVFGSLLHDVGKIIYRGTSEKNKHSILGAKFISTFDEMNKPNIINCIRYHHAREISKIKSSHKLNELFYLTYIADNISSAMDRRKDIEEGDDGFDWDKTTPLASVFNVLNLKSKGRQDFTYPFVQRTDKKEIVNFPNELKNEYTSGYYNGLISDMKSILPKIHISYEYINSLIQMMSSLWSYVPSSTDKNQLTDISLYDHSRTTAGIAACIYDFFKENGITDYRKELFDNNADDFYKQQAFLMVSFDLSGIQNFIYNISGSEALKSLRSRSFYLDIILEFISDVLLRRLDMSRANLLYSGGGHAYLLLANTDNTKKTIKKFQDELKDWCIKKFNIDLYVAVAFVEVSGNDLMNKTGHYRDIYRFLSDKLSKNKANRYSAQEIIDLNRSTNESQRECRECKRSDLLLDNDDICQLCYSLQIISRDLIKKNIFLVSNDGDLDLPFGKKLSAITKNEAESLRKKDLKSIIYTKNSSEIGETMMTNIRMGDYTYNSEFDKILSSTDLGIKRLGVLRADVDNLGQAFINGIPDNYLSISRTATFSRQMSVFFKYYLNLLLSEKKLKVNVVYSGGDDLFIVGDWQDILKLSLKLHDKFEEFTQNKLSLSAGIGMFREKYPVARMAQQTGELEDAAKSAQNKNSLTLFEQTNVFNWDSYRNGVLAKLKLITEKFVSLDETGETFIYRLLNLLRGMSDDQQINIARLAYTLSRVEDNIGTGFSKMLFDWSSKNEDKITLIMALEIYVMGTRKR